MRCIKVSAVLAFIHWLGSALSQPSSVAWDDDFITRDVAIIGGGSAGTYAAIRLRDLGKSVVVVEKQAILGGHTDTYYDPVAGPIDYGVWIYTNTTEARDFFARLNIPLRVDYLVPSNPDSLEFDLRTGQPVPTQPGNVTAAMIRYTTLLMQYPYLENGYDLPYPVPDDLVMPFRSLVEKHDLAAAVPVILAYVQGFADVLNYPSIYIMKTFNLNVVQGAQTGFLRPASGANQDTFTAAATELGDDVLYSSTVAEVYRPHHESNSYQSESHPQRIIVNTPSGPLKIRARKILVAMPPTAENLAPFDTDDREKGIFARFTISAYYNTILRILGLPPTSHIVNRGIDTPYNIAALPGFYAFHPAVPELGLYTGFFGGGAQPLPREEVLQIMRANILSLRNAGYPVMEPEVRAFGNHTPFGLHVSSKDIKGGFYKRLNGLQGYRGTFWTGATFQEHEAAGVWGFTERLIREQILGD
ncbi:amine oxidase, flavin-containing superfamily [Aspergillus stella-maris]|uniref:amine oxidase, flavin-containing superfamily n=1 Tax=Aspergillus stella-maris TaxID=1810926 RepID=UPI003CCD9E7D